MTIDLEVDGNGFSDGPEVSPTEGAVTRMPATSLDMAEWEKPTFDFVMAALVALVAAIHDLLAACHGERRGWPGRARP
jgi:hypothetical protein